MVGRRVHHGLMWVVYKWNMGPFAAFVVFILLAVFGAVVALAIDEEFWM